jgi:hypothetical protein
MWATPSLRHDPFYKIWGLTAIASSAKEIFACRSSEKHFRQKLREKHTNLSKKYDVNSAEKIVRIFFVSIQYKISISIYS